MSTDEIVIVAAKRTPCGNLLGGLSALSAPEIASQCIQDTLTSASIQNQDIDEVYMGCVLQAGIGQAPARQALKGAGLPDSIPATTINKMCGSGMKAIMLGVNAIKAGDIKMALCGGMESMSQAPYLMKKARAGARLGHDTCYDHMFIDGLEDAYDKGKLMGVFAEETAEHFNFSREMQDEFSKRSMEKALNAIKEGEFSDEITPVTVKTRKGEITLSIDESPDPSKLDKITKLKPAFKKDGTVTAANASTISDGASVLAITTKAHALHLGLTPLATIQATSSFAHEPKWFTTAPVYAIKALLEKANWNKDEVSCYEINEAFACVTMAAIKELDLDESKVNIKGGACALGHPIGASGARILTTLLYSLKPGEKGIAALCIGGGEATAVAISRA